MKLWGLVIVMMAGTVAGRAEQRSNEAFPAIVKQMRQVKVTLTLDRSHYLPGERICATVALENPGPTSIQGFAPFEGEFGDVDLQAKDDVLEWRTLAVREQLPTVGLPDSTEAQKVIRMAAGYKESRTLCLTDAEQLRPFRKRHWDTYVLRPGRYRVVWGYANVGIQEFDIDRIDADPVVVGAGDGCRGVLGAVFRVGGRMVLVRSQGATRDVCGKLYGLDSALRALFPFVRVAEVDGPVEGLAMRRLGNGDIEMSWKGSGGREHLPVMGTEWR